MRVFSNLCVFVFAEQDEEGNGQVSQLKLLIILLKMLCTNILFLQVVVE